MNNKAELHNTQEDCYESLTFQFIRIARWLALFLLVGIGVIGTYLKYERYHEINWMFLLVCVISGVLLFWMGRCLQKSNCSRRRRNTT